MEKKIRKKKNFSVTEGKDNQLKSKISQATTLDHKWSAFQVAFLKHV